MNAVDTARPSSRRTAQAAGATLAGLGIIAASWGAAVPANAAPSVAASSTSLAAAVVPAATSATVSLPFKWSNGAAVKATVVSPTQATNYKSSQLSGLKVFSAKWDGEGFALPDGRVVGVIDGVVKVQEKNGTVRNYFKGSFKGKVEDVTLQGTTVLGTIFSPKGLRVYVFRGTGSAVSAGTFLPGAVEAPVYAGGKLYYTKSTTSQDYEVWKEEIRSIALGKSASSLVAKNARDVQLLTGRVVYSTVSAKAKDQSLAPVTSLRFADTKKVALGYTTTTWPGGKGQFPMSSVRTSSTGSTATYTYPATAGQVVLDFKQRKAWFVKASKGQVSMPASLSGSRAAWVWTSATSDGAYSIDKRALVFDTATGKYTAYKTTSTLLSANINGKALGLTVVSSNWSRFHAAAGLIK